MQSCGLITSQRYISTAACCPCSFPCASSRGALRASSRGAAQHCRKPCTQSAATTSQTERAQECAPSAVRTAWRSARAEPMAKCGPRSRAPSNRGSKPPDRRLLFSLRKRTDPKGLKQKPDACNKRTRAHTCTTLRGGKTERPPRGPNSRRAGAARWAGGGHWPLLARRRARRRCMFGFRRRDAASLRELCGRSAVGQGRLYLLLRGFVVAGERWPRKTVERALAFAPTGAQGMTGAGRQALGRSRWSWW